MRDASSIANVVAKPDSAEHTEKMTTVASRMDLRLPVRSERYPMPRPDSAQANDSAEESMPSCGVRELEVRLHEGPEIAHRVPVEEHEAEHQAEHRHQAGLIAPHSGPRHIRAPSLSDRVVTYIRPDCILRHRCRQMKAPARAGAGRRTWQAN